MEECKIPAAALESVVRTEELFNRPSRPPDHKVESAALLALASSLADSPRTILQTLADKVLEVLQIGSAGLSLLTRDEKRFYWAAIAGAWRSHIGGSTPRNFGPCGDVLDQNHWMLFTHWERRYPYLMAAPLADEGLLVPFYVNDKAVGTIWAVAHDPDRKFDAEDLRLLESMSRFASTAYQVLESNENLKVEIVARKKAEALIATNLRDMTLINELSNYLIREGSDFNRNLTAVVETAIAIAAADKGNLQLLDKTTGVLTLAAQRGFDDPFVNFFASVGDDASACAAALRSGERVIVQDVRESKLFAGQPSKDVLIDAGVCAVTSTPLIASTGNLLGMISTHFVTPHRPSERELHLIDLLARQTADYLEGKRADEIQTTLAREVQHRSNNLLAVVQAIASRSLSGTYTLAEAKAAFEARLQALARANAELTKSNWSGVNLSEIVRLELQPYAERIIVDGIDVMLSPQYAQSFTLTMHELATNAAKYGALSNGSGTVGVSWTIARQSKNSKLEFKWQERGGPPVIAPTRQGFGTLLVMTTFPDARIDYAVEGLSYEISIPVNQNYGPR